MQIAWLIISLYEIWRLFCDVIFVPVLLYDAYLHFMSYSMEVMLRCNSKCTWSAVFCRVLCSNGRSWKRTYKHSHITNTQRHIHRYSYSEWRNAYKWLASWTKNHLKRWYNVHLIKIVLISIARNYFLIRINARRFYWCAFEFYIRGHLGRSRHALQCDIKEYDVIVWNGFFWLKIESRCRLSWTQELIIGFYKLRGISLLAEGV